MDVRIYFNKLRQAESAITEPYVVVVSLETPDGGKAGRLTEVSKTDAAALLVEGRARLATAEEAEGFHAQIAQARQAAEQASLSNKVQVTVLSEQDMRALKTTLRGSKS